MPFSIREKHAVLELFRIVNSEGEGEGGEFWVG
jgi:hypothetical protein